MRDRKETVGLYASPKGREYLREQLEIYIEETGRQEWIIAGLIADNPTEQGALRSAIVRWKNKKQIDLYENYPSRNIQLLEKIEILLLSHETTRTNIIFKAKQDFYLDQGDSLAKFIFGRETGSNLIASIEIGLSHMDGLFQVMKPAARGWVPLDKVPDEDDDWVGWTITPEYYYFYPTKNRKFAMAANFVTGLAKNKFADPKSKQDYGGETGDELSFIDLWLGIAVIRHGKLDMFLSSNIFSNIKRHDRVEYEYPDKSDDLRFRRKDRSCISQRLFTESLRHSDMNEAQMSSATSAGYIRANLSEFILTSPSDPFYAIRIKNSLDKMLWDTIP